MSNQLDDLYKKWDGWLDVLDGEITELRTNQHIYKEVEGILRTKEPNDFYIWMRDMYSAAMSAAIRRQTDKGQKAISFRRLLESLKVNPGVVTRTRFKRNFVGGHYTERDADEGFDQLVGAGKEHPEGSDLDEEIKKLEKITEILRHYVDKRIAHRDQQELRVLPTFKDLDDAIDHLEKLLRKYYCIFRCLDTPELLPVWQHNWKSIFYHPWIGLGPENR